ncbi:hypothetical protein GALL_402070 [mine drainage metagenome]|uniref:Uncharacterized protein n=1 Tax=mine drainage metagenome TaxID=410659 RepID=A0A1J5Q491_9ZZZZ
MRDLERTRRTEVVQHVGEVGRLQVFVRCEQQRGALPGRAARQACHGVPVDHEGLAAAPQQRALAGRHVPAHEDLREQPVPVALLLDRQVLDGRASRPVDELDGPVEELADRQGLGGALLEPPHVHQPGGDHLPDVDAGHARERQEHAATPGHFDDQPDRAGSPARPEQHDDVAHAPDQVADGVEDGGAGEARDEDPGSRGAHGGQPSGGG